MTGAFQSSGFQCTAFQHTDGAFQQSAFQHSAFQFDECGAPVTPPLPSPAIEIVGGLYSRGKRFEPWPRARIDHEEEDVLVAVHAILMSGALDDAGTFRITLH